MSDEVKGTDPSVKLIHLRCKKDECNSNLATEVTPPNMGDGVHTYQCITCKYTWGISLGGGVNF